MPAIINRGKKGLIQEGIMEMKKKAWETPQLIILARGTPEESVLTQCKRIGSIGATSAQSIGQQGCDEPALGNCGACQARGGS
jgi:hypothetical protein